VQGESWGTWFNGVVISAKTKSGRQLDVAMSAALIRNPDGEGDDTLEGTIIIFEDVTERNRFLRVAAHELRNPLAMLHTSLQLLMRRLQLQPIDVERIRADGARILNAVAHLNALTAEVFDVVRLGEGRFPVEREPLDLVDLTRNVLNRFLVGDSYQLAFDAPDTPLWVLGAPRRIEQVLGNLLQNAIKYSPRGGAIRVNLAADDQRVRVAVRDEGIGIPPADQARVFDGFFRASNIDASGPAGIGLGLYICRDIMARHGGRIWLQSELGRGTTVTFELDRYKADGMDPVGQTAPSH
ncbi:MAG TPA: HAMP domain-containing sensor histidine kinase, partial [Limnochordia bacterium]|nr:HAMP domain-containing sensor histidine kinase [Limnochordia bacterium]